MAFRLYHILDGTALIQDLFIWFSRKIKHGAVWVLGGVGTATRTLMGGVTCVLHIKLCPLSPYKLQFAVCDLKLTIHGL